MLGFFNDPILTGGVPRIFWNLNHQLTDSFEDKIFKLGYWDQICNNLPLAPLNSTTYQLLVGAFLWS